MLLVIYKVLILSLSLNCLKNPYVETDFALVPLSCLDTYDTYILNIHVYLQKSLIIMPKTSNCSRLFVAAIDFGTAYSGYAFSSKADWTKVRTPTWPDGTMLSSKAPTAALLKSDKTFDSFGYEAERKYAELAGEKNHEDYFYFNRFKMKLDDQKVCSGKERDNVSDILRLTLSFQLSLSFVNLYYEDD